MSDEGESERDVRLSRPVCGVGRGEGSSLLVGQSRCDSVTKETCHVLGSVEHDNGETNEVSIFISLKPVVRYLVELYTMS